MSEHKKAIPENAEGNFLADDQLSAVTGGTMDRLVLHPMGYRRCAANPAHLYVDVLGACPECGCREYTPAE